jgi:hypothetical protein
MTLAALFRACGAPLTNARWSWGGVRVRDGAVFLCVWQDRMTKHTGRWFMMVTHHAYQPNKEDPGYQERLGHIDLIRHGAPSYMVMCVARDIEAVPRKMQSFNSDAIFVGGQLVELGHEMWIERVDRKPIALVVDRKQP